MRIPVALAASAAVLFALAGCSGSSTTFAGGVTQPDPLITTQAPIVTPSSSNTPTPSSTPTSTPTSGATHGPLLSCASGEVTINSSVKVASISGSCASVIIQGQSITLNAGAIDRLQISGVGNKVTTASLGSVVINGQNNAVAGAPVGTVSISGDTNTVSSSSTVDGITVTGNDNVISAPGGALSITDGGARNQVPAKR